MNLFWKTEHSQDGWVYQQHRFDKKKRRIVSFRDLCVGEKPHTWYLLFCSPVIENERWVDMVNCFGTAKSELEKTCAKRIYKGSSMGAEQ